MVPRFAPTIGMKRLGYDHEAIPFDLTIVFPQLV